MAFDKNLILMFAMVVVCFAVFVMLVYRTTHWLLSKNITQEQTGILDWGAFRISVIHALLLTIGFSEIRSDFNNLRHIADQQAIEIEKLYNGLIWLDEAEADVVRMHTVKLARVLVNEEWQLLSEGELSPAADNLISQIGSGLVDLSEASSDMRLIDSLIAVQETRTKLSLSVVSGSAHLFWSIALLGFIFTSVCFLAYPAGRTSTIVIGMFAALNGAVLFGIVLMSNPFEKIVQISPVSLESLIARTLSTIDSPNE